MAEINWTLETEHWLKDIHDYISLDNPTAAQKVVKEIYQKTQLLVRFPEIDILVVFHGALEIDKYLY